MKWYCLVVAALIGCGGEAPLEQAKQNTFFADDQLNGCYAYNGGQFSVCISVNFGTGEGWGRLMNFTGSQPCWKIGDPVWDGINGAYPDYNATRHSGQNCDNPVPSGLACLLDGSPVCLHLQESGSVFASWDRYPDSESWDPGTGCVVANYHPQNGSPDWQMQMPGGTLVSAPVNDPCWKSGDAAWTQMKFMGQGWHKGNRWNPGGSNRPYCSLQTAQNYPGSVKFKYDCSEFTEYSGWGTMTWVRSN